MGGLISSAILTLIFLPTVSNGMEGVAGWLRGIWRASAPRSEVVTGEATGVTATAS
jgi:hypothetical protein